MKGKEKRKGYSPRSFCMHEDAVCLRHGRGFGNEAIPARDCEAQNRTAGAALRSTGFRDDHREA